MLNVNIISCLQDNYSFIIHDTETNTVGVVDPSEFNPIENFITKGINEDYRTLGVFYILTALTLVSEKAAQSLPWLYESVVQN